MTRRTACASACTPSSTGCSPRRWARSPRACSSGERTRLPRVKRALISVADKTGLETFARGLVEQGVELISTSGTASFLADHGLPVTRVEDLTGMAEMLGGRVKTLHPKLHGALLARRDSAPDRQALAEFGIDPI